MAFERSYAPMRQNFVSGTAAIPKQILRGMLSRLAKGHTCVAKLHVRPKAAATTKVDDSLLYRYYPQNRHHSFYSVEAVAENGDVVTREILTQPTNFGVANGLNWSRVGAYSIKSLVHRDSITTVTVLNH